MYENDGLDAGALARASSRRIVMLTADGPPAAVSRILEELRDRDVDYALVSGAQRVRSRVVSALERYGEDALYVICRDGSLDDGAAARMRDYLLDTQLIAPRNLMVLKVRAGKWGYQTSALQQRAKNPSLLGPPRKGETLPEDRDFLEPASSAPPVASAGGLADRMEPRRVPVVVGAANPRHPGASLFVGGTLVALAVGLAASFAGFTVDDARDWWMQRGQVGEATPVAASASARDPVMPGGKAGASARTLAAEPAERDRFDVDEEVELAGPVDLRTEGPPTASEPAMGMDVGTDAAEGADAEANESPSALRLAIRAGEIRELHHYLVDVEASGEMDLSSAREYCAGRSRAGVQGWRLAEIGELSSLVDARVVRTGQYWSVTPADAEAHKYLLYDGSRSRIVAQKLQWSRGRAVCVRNREVPPRGAGTQADPQLHRKLTGP